ncbi:P-loop containing nucleoside triphosphate hydrolase protein [Gaertneriomyces semiglobifer]|nr:P-loop containing nucleoside triphosphate hydrolase protein [Gaertneriomyces semiglobifer]
MAAIPHSYNDITHSAPSNPVTHAQATATETLVKILVLGDSGVGKSALCARMLGKPFSLQHRVTNGIDFGTCIVRMSGANSVKAQIVDTSGLNRFRQIIQSYLHLGNGALIVYSCDSRSSFDNIRHWVSDFKAKQPNKKRDPVIMIVGTKSDCAESERQVPTQEGQAYAVSQGFLFMETSALTGHNVALAFNVLLTDVYYAMVPSTVPAVSITRAPTIHSAAKATSPITVPPRSPSPITPRSSSLSSSPPAPLSPAQTHPGQPKHKSFDERLLEQAKALFTWITPPSTDETAAPAAEPISHTTENSSERIDSGVDNTSTCASPTSPSPLPSPTL